MSDHETAVALTRRLLTARHMGGLSPAYLAEHYAEETGADRDETQAALQAAVDDGALVVFSFDDFPMVTTPDKVPAYVRAATPNPESEAR